MNTLTLKNSFLKYILCFTILFVFNFYKANSQKDNNVNDIDSLRAVIKTSRGIDKIEALNTLGSYLTTSNTEEAEVLLIEARSLSEEQQYHQGFIDNKLYLATLKSYLNDYVTCEELLNSAIQLCNKHNYKKGLANAELGFGALMIKKGEQVKAIEHYIKSLKVTKEIENIHLEGTILMNIGFIKQNLNELDEANKYLTNAANLFEKNNMHYRSGQAYINLAVLEYSKKNLGLSIDYNKKALTIFDRIDDNYNTAICLGNLGFAYKKDGDYNKAIEYYNKSLVLKKGIKDKKGEAKILLNMSEIHQLKNQNDKAIKFAKKSLNISKELKNETFTKNAYYALYQLYNKNNNTPLALDNYKNYTAIKDSITEKNNKIKIAELTKKFDLTNLESENKKNQLKLKKQKNTLTSLTIIIVLIIIFFIWLFIKTRKNQQNLETNLSSLKKEMHDLKNESENSLRELTGKNEVINELKTQLKENKNPRNNGNLQKMIKSITNDNNWTAFNLYFQNTYPNFFEKLQNDYPKINLMDKHLITLIKINLSNKEIGKVLNISRESVAKAKYRLRKKMNINSATEMEQVISKN